MSNVRIGTIEVEGSDPFVAKTTEAIHLLNKTSAFWDVRRYLGKILEADRSGMRAYDTPPTYQVGQQTWVSHVIWYASTIAHDTYHSYLYHMAGYKSANVPDDAWTGAGAEKQCNEFQLRVLGELKKFNDSEASRFITYLQGLMGSGTDYYSNYASRNW